MAEETETPTETPTEATTPVEETVAPIADMEAKKQQILQLTSKRHEKIWLLHEICLMSNKEIATAMGTNNGHVGNCIKDYNEHPEKMVKAKELLK